MLLFVFVFFFRLFLFIPFFFPLGQEWLSYVGGNFRALFEFSQVLALLPSLRMDLPDVVHDLVSWLVAFNFNVDLAAPECAAPTFTYWHKNLVKLLLPIALLLVVVLVAAIVFAVLYCRRSGQTAAKWAHTKEVFFERLVFLGIATVSVCYTLIISTTLDPFRCTFQVDGRRSLTTEPAIICYEGEWLSNLPIAVVAFVTYVVGIPVFFGAMLFSFRHRLSSPRAAGSIGYLYKKYEAEWFYWDVVVMVRKALLVSILPFASPATIQSALAVLLYLFALLGQAFARPYLNTDHDRMDSMMLFITFIIFFVALLSQTGELDLGQDWNALRFVCVEGCVDGGGRLVGGSVGGSVRCFRRPVECRVIGTVRCVTISAYRCSAARLACGYSPYSFT